MKIEEKINEYILNEGKKTDDFVISYIIDDPMKDGDKILKAAKKTIEQKYDVKFNNNITMNSEGYKQIVGIYKKDRLIKQFGKKDDFIVLVWKEYNTNKKGVLIWSLLLKFSIDEGGYFIDNKQYLEKVLNDNHVPRK
jgi:hypothetical protein